MLAGKTVNPSFLAIHPNHKFLYAVGEVEDFKGKKSGGVNAFAIDPKTGELIDLSGKAGVVEKSGAWFSYDSQRIGQGRENAKAFLKANSDIAGKIEATIRQNAGLIAEKILAGEEGEAAAEDAAEG